MPDERSPHERDESPMSAHDGAAPSAAGAAPTVFGAVLDASTRCIHFHSERDIVAIKFACCLRYYPCSRCHDEAVRLEPTPHATRRWPLAQWSELAILCGACHRELSITEYRRADRCPRCTAEFNPGCRLHAHLYFDEP
ncbi:putative CHY-type Zn-finger protein [Cryobacterium sp. CAN_C3]|uniref:CHY zinc finger protein n=2 Tax=Cryobacterium TaxID=69578 RepID=UPI001A1A65AB|nr:putative CHY-type Zn-finger protein [Cryobacterium sp. CAN_C3]